MNKWVKLQFQSEIFNCLC